jgi:hypothetical protein
MNDWFDNIPVLRKFSEVTDAGSFLAIPDDWWICVSDVVHSSKAISEGKYKAVNLAGAGTISAVSNALDGALKLFAFGGDGASIIIAPAHHEKAREALERTAVWAKRDLDLELRVGLARVGDARSAGFDVRAAFWQASENVEYAMFAGGGLEWATRQLKSGAISFQPSDGSEDPDLTGLSCQWGPMRSVHGSIVSLIVKPGAASSPEAFNQLAYEIIELLEADVSANPVPAEGPEVRLPSNSIGLQSRVAHRGESVSLRRLRVCILSILSWIVFKLGVRIGPFEPDRYRREIAENTDFRKFEDGLYMTVDCSIATVHSLRALLERGACECILRYGLHEQEEALMTCVVPSLLSSAHMHFVDGADGGYATAARQLQ